MEAACYDCIKTPFASLFVLKKKLCRGDSSHSPLTIAVNPSAINRLATKNLETICSPKFSAARRDLGIDFHWMLVFENIADLEPDSNTLMKILLDRRSKPI